MAAAYTWQVRKLEIETKRAKENYDRHCEHFGTLTLFVVKKLKRNEQLTDRLIEESNLLMMIRDDLATEIEGFKVERERVLKALHGQNSSRKKKVRGKKKVS
ncbi:hypothetical protein FZW96_11975 [Bacillus sp. BGMRC 2118]|nr:hypothetical protein FZW96_11975 [Bacillus sp. BGMRC 2118]